MTTDTTKLRELLAKATAAPWKAERSRSAELSWCDGAQCRLSADWKDSMGNTPEIAKLSKQNRRTVEKADANGALIVAAVNILSELLDEIDQLRELAIENKCLRTTLERISTPGGSRGET